MKWLLLLAVLPLLFGLGAIALNRPPLLDPPGLWPRLGLYLGTNVAETRPDHPRPELRPRTYAVAEGPLRRHVREAMGALGWGEIRETDGVLRAVVASALFRFKDDVEVRFDAQQDGVRVSARSASRLGRGDFGANTRHLLDLYAALDRRTGAL